MEATFASGYICGYVDFEVRIFQNEVEGATDRYFNQTGKAKSKAYKVSDDRGLFLWVTPSLKTTIGREIAESAS